MTTEQTDTKTRLKKHWTDHKKKYFIGAGAAACVGVGVVIGSRVDQVNIVVNDVLNLRFWSPSKNIIEIAKPGNSGDILWDTVNKTHYFSRNQAADALGKTRKSIAKAIADGDLELVQKGNTVASTLAN